eukprot:m.32601 g.32601  ORF g.32601 m.32601 type:complete len:119 (-) comp10074_c0_seq2:421-777(-)
MTSVGAQQQHIQCVAVGDSQAGKTALLAAYTTNRFHSDPLSVFRNQSVTIVVDQEPMILELFDTPGQEEYDSLRPMAYPNADVFLVCFSIANPQSLAHVREKVRQDCQRVLYPRCIPN